MSSDTQFDKANDLFDQFSKLPKEKVDALKGNPKAVLNFIDEYSEKHRMMTIGELKGKLIYDKIVQKNPTIMLELGCFVGYSAIYFAQGLASSQNAKYYSFESDERCAEIAQAFIDVAGLTDRIEIIVGKAGQTLEEFQQKLYKKFGKFTSADFIFIDHWKDMYVPDLRVLETIGLIAPGTVIAADNIYFPGAPEYVKYVQSSPEEKRIYNYDHENISNKNFLGRWNILYETKTVEVDFPNGHKDAVEFTKCTDYLNG
jgi:catechol O-methyltransferase